MNPFLGVFFHWLGGLASGSFYVPYKGVKKWAWEVYWLVGGFFSWIICPWILASLLTNDLFGVLRQQSMSTLWWTYFFGAMWGFGGLTFGLTMRYLGMSLGMGVALGYCAAFGTLMPPIFKTFIPSIPVAETIGQIAATTPGQGHLVRRAGLLDRHRRGRAGRLDQGKGNARGGEEEGDRRVQLHQGHPRRDVLRHHERLLRLRADGRATRSARPRAPPAPPSSGPACPSWWWCCWAASPPTSSGASFLNLKNRTGYQYFSSTLRNSPPGAARRPSSKPPWMRPAKRWSSTPRGPRPSAIIACRCCSNYFFSALAGTTWYFQFFFYTMGETQMGKFGFASWTLHMASIIIFSTMWGWIFHEWKGSSKKAHSLIASGIAMLILSTIIIGVGAGWTNLTAFVHHSL